MAELAIPPAALRDHTSVEVARVWIAERGLHCTLKVGLYEEDSDVDEEIAWAIMLSDLARHASSALAALTSKPENEVLMKLVQHLNKELAAPSSEVRGAFEN